MRGIFIALTILLSFSAVAQNGEKNFIDLNYIEVTGKSEMEISPDLIFLKILLNEKDSKNKIPVSELEKQMTDKLSELGVNVSRDLLVKDISSNFKYYLLTKNEIMLSKEYQLLVRDAKTAGKVFIELEKIGISNITVERLDHSKIIDYRREVKINAIVAAKEKAQSLALAINQDIGRAIFIQELGNRYQGNMTANNIEIRGYVNSGVYSDVSNLDIGFEKIKLEYTVMCRFVLK